MSQSRIARRFIGCVQRASPQKQRIQTPPLGVPWVELASFVREFEATILAPVLEIVFRLLDPIPVDVGDGADGWQSVEPFDESKSESIVWRIEHDRGAHRQLGIVLVSLHDPRCFTQPEICLLRREASVNWLIVPGKPSERCIAPLGFQPRDAALCVCGAPKQARRQTNRD